MNVLNEFVQRFGGSIKAKDLVLQEARSESMSPVRKEKNWIMN